MKKIAMMFLLGAVLMTVACAHAGGRGGSGKEIAVDIPDGWKRLNVAKFLILTREDPYQQYILAQERPLAKPFRNTNKTFRMDILPLEAAGIVIDELKFDQKLIDVEILTVTPAAVNGGEGFKIIFTYRDETGGDYKTLYYGFFEGEFFYSLRYTARAKLYRNEDVRDFHAVLASFRLEIPEEEV